jgi:predicted nucleotidyltransferase
VLAVGPALACYDFSAMAPDELLRRVAEALAPLDAVRLAWVFGSRVRGGATDRSDLDVAVVFPRELGDAGRERVRRAIVAALTDALGAVGERADVVDLDFTSSGVAFRAIAEGRRALARSESERVAAEVRIARRYDDEAPRRELYRRAARNHAGGPGGRR